MGLQFPAAEGIVMSPPEHVARGHICFGNRYRQELLESCIRQPLPVAQAYSCGGHQRLVPVALGGAAVVLELHSRVKYLDRRG